MPPKFLFTRDQIIEAALRITRRGGLSALTARSLAAELGCSVKPIFGLFRNMEEVQQAGESLLAPTDSLFRQYPAYRLATEKADRACRCGNPIPASDLAEGLYRVYGLDGQFLCLSIWKNGVLISQKNFFGA